MATSQGSILESLLSLLSFVLLMHSSHGQILSLGGCPDLPVVKNFDVSRYLGKFYEIEKYFSLFELGGMCVTVKFTDLGNSTLGLYNSKTQSLSRQRNTVTATARVVDPEGSAKLGVKFSSIPFAEAPYWVLDTDYDNYSVVWSCNSMFSVVNFQRVWFLSRTRFPTDEIKRKAYHTMESLGLSTSRLQKTEQRKCPETY